RRPLVGRGAGPRAGLVRLALAGEFCGLPRKRRLAEVMASPTWYWSRRESPRLATTKKGA
ncbi:TPA: hypothetical protein ACS53L_005168, partial [Salmonella enterica]